MFKLLGYFPKEITPSYEVALSHVHEDYKDEYVGKIGIAFDSKSSYFQRNKMTTIEGESVDVISRGKSIINDEGDLIRMIGTIQKVGSYQ